jgi:ketosteroid isomerase-like protein
MRPGIAYLFFSATFVFPLTACAPVEPEGPDLDAEAAVIREATQAWFAAEREGNVDAIMPFVAEDAVFLPPDAPAFSGLEAIRQFYQDFVALGVLDIGGGSERLVISSAGDLAFDIGTSYMVAEGPEGQIRSEGKYLSVWQKIEGRWQTVSISWSANAPVSD